MSSFKGEENQRFCVLAPTSLAGLLASRGAKPPPLGPRPPSLSQGSELTQRECSPVGVSKRRIRRGGAAAGARLSWALSRQRAEAGSQCRPTDPHMPGAWHLKGLGRVPVLRPGGQAGVAGGTLGCGSEEKGSLHRRALATSVAFCPVFLSTGVQGIHDGYGYL